MWIVVKNILIVVSIIITGTFIYTLITLSLTVRYNLIHRQNDKYYPEWKEQFKNYFMEDWMKNSFGVIMTILVIWCVYWVINVFVFYFEYH
jgi:ribose/xylose/arabinose/galactoside ABC-type transport system permease subunit